MEHTLKLVDARLDAITGSCDQLVINYIKEVSSVRGKQIRPRLMIMQANLFGQADMAVVANCAACCELLHTATLIHDDVIDSAEIRRGLQTLNNHYGNEIAVVVGDYILALVFKSINNEHDFTLNDMILETSQEMGLGVIEEIHHRNNFQLGLEKYYEVIYLKTAALFKLCCEMGAYLGGADAKEAKLAGDYGKQLGLGFQIVDDLLDLTVDAKKTGKQGFNDLREGRITLPVIHGLLEAPDKTRELVEEFQAKPTQASGLLVRKHLEELGSLDFAREVADGFIGTARGISKTIRQNGTVLAESPDLQKIEQRIVSVLEPRAV